MSDFEKLSDMSENGCRRCKVVVKTGLKCTVCSRVSHKCCLKILNIDVDAKDGIICCNDSNKSSSSSTDLDLNQNLNFNSNSTLPEPSYSKSEHSEEYSALKIKFLEQMVADKEMIIQNQGIAIKALTEQIDVMKYSMSLTNVSNFSVAPLKHQATSTAEKSQSEYLIQKEKTNLVSKISVSKAIENAEGHRICSNIVNLNGDVNPIQSVSNMSNEAEQISWKSSKDEIEIPKKFNNINKQNRNTTTTSLLVGSRRNPEDSTLKAAVINATSKMYTYHASNFAIDASDVELNSHLAKFAPNVMVEKLNARYPNVYASFKISVPITESQAILDSSIWPYGVVLNRFFRSRRVTRSML